MWSGAYAGKVKSHPRGWVPSHSSLAKVRLINVLRTSLEVFFRLLTPSINFCWELALKTLATATYRGAL